MKQQLVIAIAIALTSVNAFATRAATQSLGNSPHLLNTQSVYTQPYKIMDLAGDYVTLESGGLNTDVANENAEGMIVRSMGDAKMGLALGHQSMDRGALITGTGDLNQQNPIEFTYGAKAGDINWAGTFIYSSFNNKAPTAVTDLEKESSMGVRFGASTGAWAGAVALDLTNTAELGNGDKFTGTPGINLNGTHSMETMLFFGNIASGGSKVEVGATETKLATQNVRLGVVNSHKKDGNEVFYSVAYNMDTIKVGDAKAEATTTLPITIGLAVEANSWLTLRGSATQSTLINNANETGPGANSTTVAAGAGLKFNKVTVDGTFVTATTQEIDSNNLLAQVGMSYWF